MSIRECTILLLLIAIAVLALAPSPKAAPPQGVGAYVVVDGDTIRSPAGVPYRLIGFDTPETFHARCAEELSAGLKAKARLEELLASGEVRLIETGKIDRYGRSLATLTIDGVDVAKILIGEGLARPYSGRGQRGSWC
jgi:micrococcal nuclease